MNLRTPMRVCLTLSCVVLGACDNAPGLSQSSAVPSPVPATGTHPGQAPETTTPTDGFRPDDPNTFVRKPESTFPRVSFRVEGVPTGLSDRYLYSLPLRADPSISHYAYKVASTDACKQTGGYTVSDVQKAIKLNIEEMPEGPVHLCVIAFHFPTRQWQDVSKALAYNWQKIPFERTISNYFEDVDPDCKNAVIRFNSVMTINDKKGSYRFQRTSIPGCVNNDPVSYTGLLSMVKVTESTLEAYFHEGQNNNNTGWVKLEWTNPERTAFKGSWGFGEPGSKAIGAWNSLDQ